MICDGCRKRDGTIRNGYRFVDGRRQQVWLCDGCESTVSSGGRFWCNSCRRACRIDDRYRDRDRYCRACKSAATRAAYARKPEYKRAQAKRYYEAHKDYVLERVRQHTAAHPEVRRAYKARNRERIAAQSRAWYHRNRDALRARVRARRAANPELFRVRSQQSYHRRRLRLWFGRRAA